MQVNGSLIEVEILFKDGTSEIKVIENNSKNQNFSFVFTKKPVGMQFDKLNKIPLKEVHLKEL